MTASREYVVSVILLSLLLFLGALPMVGSADAASGEVGTCAEGRRIRDICVADGSAPTTQEVCPDSNYYDMIGQDCVQFAVASHIRTCADPYYLDFVNCTYLIYDLGDDEVPVCPPSPNAQLVSVTLTPGFDGLTNAVCTHEPEMTYECWSSYYLLTEEPYNGRTCAIGVESYAVPTCPLGQLYQWADETCVIFSDPVGTVVEACSVGALERLDDRSYRCFGVGPPPVLSCPGQLGIVEVSGGCFSSTDPPGDGECVGEAFQAAFRCWLHIDYAELVCSTDLAYQLVDARCLFISVPQITVPPRPGTRLPVYFDIDNFNRDSVVNSYRADFEPALAVSADWTGSTASCDPGQVSDNYRYAAHQLINWTRSLAGLAEPMAMDASYLPEVQASSLIMAAQGELSHQPPDTWACWTPEGFDGANRSNLGLGGAQYSSRVLGFIYDYGSNNAAVGHRWWALRPGMNYVEYGAASSAVTMWVVDPDNGFGAVAAEPTIWPPPGFFPESLLAPRISIFAWSGPFVPSGRTDYSVDLDVRVNGSPVQAVVEHKGADRLVFAIPNDVMTELRGGFADRVIDVDVRIQPGFANELEFSWSTVVIDPDYDPRCNGQTPTVQISAGQMPTANDDVIIGTDGDDHIDGLGGDDVICGGAGNDTIVGGAGNDVLIGGDGDDRLFGGDGSDVLRGNAGRDELKGQTGADRILGGIGDDVLDGGGGHDFLGGFGGADTINGGAGHDVIFGGFGADVIDGGPGNDQVHGLVGDDIIRGGNGDDQLDGDRGNDSIDGDDGNDVIRGGNAADVLRGGAGDDQVSGGRADDRLSGGDGLADVCTGNKQVVADTADSTCETIFGVP